MLSDVFTLEELADYLKLSPEMVLAQANQGKLPGRKIEDTWRFLKTAIDDWLRAQDSRALLRDQKLRQPGLLEGKLGEAFFEPLPEEELQQWE
jgi:excisionase family DNA binding protein